MLYFVVPVNNGVASLSTNPRQQPRQSYDFSSTQRYCEFQDNITVMPEWVSITEAQFNANKPTADSPVTPLSIEDIHEENLTIMMGLADIYEFLATLGS